ncbi:hypothetical protein [Arthrobacter roseus]|uniref:hypothetical protein n=1 Tax=Arthrobacter roseus TaxID=136274 RepID=UPI0030840B53|nr:hypothetical protein [Arthrobacter roseus]
MSAPGSSRKTFQSSELSRASAEVFAAAADHPVWMTRRDGESWVLMSESADKARASLLELAAQLVAHNQHRWNAGWSHERSLPVDAGTELS